MAHLNVFEGSRRIALLLKVIWVVGVAILFATQSREPYLHFVTSSPNEDFRIGPDNCSFGTDAMEFIGRDVGNGKSAEIQLCFKASRSNSGSQVVFYKSDSDGILWGNGPRTTEVQKYAEARAEAFTLNEAEQQAARNELNRLWWRNIGNGVLLAIGGWIALSLLQLVLGWIVRGFMGIPRGLDRRPAQSKQSAEAL